MFLRDLEGREGENIPIEDEGKFLTWCCLGKGGMFVGY
jgi:hypothetical protein